MITLIKIIKFATLNDKKISGDANKYERQKIKVEVLEKLRFSRRQISDILGLHTDVPFLYVYLRFLNPCDVFCQTLNIPCLFLVTQHAVELL